MRNDDEFARKNGKIQGSELLVGEPADKYKDKDALGKTAKFFKSLQLPQLHTGFAHIAHSQDNSFENQLLWTMVKSHWKGKLYEF